MCSVTEVEDSIQSWLLNELAKLSEELSNLKLRAGKVEIKKNDGDESGSEICVWVYDASDSLHVIDVIEYHITGSLAIGKSLSEIKLFLSNALKAIVDERRSQLSED